MAKRNVNKESTRLAESLLEIEEKKRLLIDRLLNAEKLTSKEYEDMCSELRCLDIKYRRKESQFRKGEIG